MACDRCWRLKARCVFDPIQDDDCAQCRKQNAECKWTRNKKPTPTPDKDYVLYLEERVKQIEQRLKQVLPGINIKREIDSLLEIDDVVEEGNRASFSNDATASQTSTSRARDSPTLSRQHSLGLVSAPFASRLLQTIRLTDTTSTPPTAGDWESDSTWKSIPSNPLPQYYGPSSTAVLVQDAQPFFSRPVSEGGYLGLDYRYSPSAESHLHANDDPHTLADLQAVIPSGDLLSVLVDGYFEHTNLVLPVLHRPLFESQLRGNLHTQDGDFARLLLIVCAIGSRWCNDSRVLDDEWKSELSAGYRWFRSAYRSEVNTVYRPSVINVQFMVLCNVFLLGTSFRDAAWVQGTKASRMFEALGAHRRKQSLTLADELIKRAFRCHFILDRFARYQFVFFVYRRPSAFQSIDIDADEVMEIDDLSWTPELNALPPPRGSSSPKLAALNHVFRLCVITGQALQTVFAPVSVKVKIGIGSPQGEEWIVRSLNQQLNRKVPGIAAASFHNCRQAARQCARVVQAYHEIPGALPLQYAFSGIFSSAMILVIDLIVNSCTEHRKGETSLDGTEYNPTANEQDIRICSAALERLERYCQIAGRLNDIIREFQDFWSYRLSTQSTATIESNVSWEIPGYYDTEATGSIAPETSGFSGLYAQQSPRISMLAWEQSTYRTPTANFPELFMGIPSLPVPQAQFVSNPIGIPNELQGFPYDDGPLSESWMLNMDNMIGPGSTADDFASLHRALEQAQDWNNTMESILRFNEGESMP
ncbi:Coiled-coil domain-containing protein 175 [Mus musculus] [Rhizoctonia solani]|uniref:Coiled-coil domain-containing protein 175 [Mus musculus] n=1 Tax=Rhizoctonia solani TaxID=456999 RepID=A0A0K6FXI0_9AGAM|nr:Coiled-coil domain-containing protein 175 [Mus musculus] [Rhizoctonia solani]